MFSCLGAEPYHRGEMEKRRFEQVCFGDEEEDGEIRASDAGEEADPKKPRGGAWEELVDDEIEEEEEVDPAGGEQEVDFDEANWKDEERDSSLENAKPISNVAEVCTDENKLANPISTSDLSSGEESREPTEAKTQKGCSSDTSEVLVALQKFGALTGDTHRLKWLEKVVQGFRFVDSLDENEPFQNGKEVGEHPSARKSVSWIDTSLPATVALEKAVHEALGSDFRKYNQKMRQLDFNLKHNSLLARRFLKGELEPRVIICMSPDELKEGVTSHEKRKEPEQSQYIQMADARCSRCSETRVGVVEIIHAGGHGDRYQLECASCGHSWSASIDDISSLTIESTSGAGNVGAAPWATAKFEDVERKLLSPHEGDKNSIDLLQRATEPYIPVMETRRSPERWSEEDAHPWHKMAD